MIEPISAAAIALATILSTKALEKVGEHVGDALATKTHQFLALLKKQAPATVAAIEQAPAQPVDYGQMVLALKAVAEVDMEVNQAMQELAAATTAETNPKLVKILEQNLASLHQRSYLDWKNHLVTDPNIMGGEVVFPNSRLTVRRIGMLLEQGESPEIIIEDYPYLSEEDIQFAHFYVKTFPI